MDNITCPVCGGHQATQINTHELQCSYCGSVFPLASLTTMSPIGVMQGESNGNIVIHGYSEVYAINPNVKVYVNGTLVGEVSRNGELALNIAGPCQMKFSCSFRSTTINVDPQTCSDVWLSFNRLTGSLNASPGCQFDAPANEEIEEREMTEEELANDNQPWWQLLITFICPIYAIFGIIDCLSDGRKKAALQELVTGIVGMIFWGIVLA